jgi:hypothetical protein
MVASTVHTGSGVPAAATSAGAELTPAQSRGPGCGSSRARLVLPKLLPTGPIRDHFTPASPFGFRLLERNLERRGRDSNPRSSSRPDTLLLTPSDSDSDQDLSYSVEFENTESVNLKICNPSVDTIDDGTTHFNLLVFDAF